MLIRKNIYRLIAISTCLIIAAVTTIQAEETSPNAHGMQGMSSAMQKSMDPNVWTNMMTMMMNPEKAMSMESCAECHDAEDVARYAKDFGPMMEAMKPMMSMMNPQMMNSMMAPMMGMMNPMMMSMMNPMAMMGPMMGMGGMSSMMGMQGSQNGTPMGQMMDPKQYEEWFSQWTDMMKNMTPQTQQNP